MSYITAMLSLLFGVMFGKLAYNIIIITFFAIYKKLLCDKNEKKSKRKSKTIIFQ